MAKRPKNTNIENQPATQRSLNFVCSVLFSCVTGSRMPVLYYHPVTGSRMPGRKKGRIIRMAFSLRVASRSMESFIMPPLVVPNLAPSKF